MWRTQSSMGQCDLWNMDLSRVFWETQRTWSSFEVIIVFDCNLNTTLLDLWQILRDILNRKGIFSKKPAGCFGLFLSHDLSKRNRLLFRHESSLTAGKSVFLSKKIKHILRRVEAN